LIFGSGVIIRMQGLAYAFWTQKPKIQLTIPGECYTQWTEASPSGTAGGTICKFHLMNFLVLTHDIGKEKL
jgi:hypothetical protein